MNKQIYIPDPKRFSVNFYDNNYIQIHFQFCGDKKYLGSENNKKCRFCNKTEPDVSFENIAHACPEMIGNKVFFSYYECDNCNSFFGNHLENQFSNFFTPFHTIYQVKGKNKKIPTTEHDVGKNKLKPIKNNETNENLTLIKTAKDSPKLSVDIDEENKKFNINIAAKTYSPIAVFKCFVKMALTLIPFKYINSFHSTIEWLLEKNHRNYYINGKKLICLYRQIAGFNAARIPECSIFIRKDISSNPYALFQLTYGNFSYVIEIPRNYNDNFDDIVHFPPVFYQTTNTLFYDFTSSEKCNNFKHSLSFNYSNITDIKKNLLNTDKPLYEKIMKEEFKNYSKNI